MGELVGKHFDDLVLSIGEQVTLETADFSGSVDIYEDAPITYTTSTIQAIGKSVV